jgi:hypothetical protein
VPAAALMLLPVISHALTRRALQPSILAARRRGNRS